MMQGLTFMWGFLLAVLLILVGKGMAAPELMVAGLGLAGCCLSLFATRNWLS